jgi:hypothetical protein
MIPVSAAISGELVWSKIPYKPGYELKHNGEIVGTLQRMNSWSSEVHAESAHGSWKFRRIGFFRTGSEIVDSISGAQMAILKRTWSGGGTLDFSDGQTFRLVSKGCWRRVWTVLAASGQPVVSIHSCEKTVDLPKELYVPEDKLILLAIFVWHIMQQASEDAVSAAVWSRQPHEERDHAIGGDPFSTLGSSRLMSFDLCPFIVCAVPLARLFHCDPCRQSRSRLDHLKRTLLTNRRRQKCRCIRFPSTNTYPSSRLGRY